MTIEEQIEEYRKDYITWVKARPKFNTVLKSIYNEQELLKSKPVKTTEDEQRIKKFKEIVWRLPKDMTFSHILTIRILNNFLKYLNLK